MRVPRTVREETVVFGLAALAAIAYASYGFVQHAHFSTHGFDLGIFDQAIWNYSHFQAPASTIRGVSSVLGDHFSPILVTLAPLYWIWPDPRMLIAAQGVLIAASVVPVFLYSSARIGRVAAYLLAGAYLLFWGIASAVAFDFHEVAFAPLLIALAIYWSDKESWRAYWIAVALLLLVKEDLAILVMFLGVYLALRKEFSRGAITATVGILSFFLTTSVLIPLFAGGTAFQYWSYENIGSNAPDALYNLIRHPDLLFSTLSDDSTKTRTLAYLFVPFLCLVLCSPLLVLVIPLVLERMLSTNSLFWDTEYHYSLSIAPVLAMGAADGLHNLVVRLGHEARLTRIAIPCAGIMLLGGLTLAHRFPLWQLTHGSFYASPEEDKSVRRAIALVPEGASVMTQDTFLPHMSERNEIDVLEPGAPPAQYIVADVENSARDVFPLWSFQEHVQTVESYYRGFPYRMIFYEHGVLVLEKAGVASRR